MLGGARKTGMCCNGVACNAFVATKTLHCSELYIMERSAVFYFVIYFLLYVNRYVI
jgi:hypothetical protein